MKKFTLAAFSLLLTIQVFSQSPRLVLHEEFTSSTCGPCVSANTKFKPWLTTYANIYTAIFYHVNWPSPGNDPMYLANPTENGARVSYYGVNSVPYAVVDGNYWKGNGNSLNIGTIQTRANVPSPFTIQLMKRTPPTQDSVYLTLVIQATEAITASMVAHTVVIEKNIHFNTPPGTNGEKDFPNVMKKMLPGKDGKLIAPSYEVGDYTIIQTSWKYANVYDTTQVAAIAFIQDKSTKEVYQAGNSTTAMPVMPFDNDLEVLEYSNVAVSNCSGKLSPVVTIRNNGNDPVTSFNVKYSVNNGAEMTYTWNGNITPLQKAVVALPEINFPLLTQNSLKIYTTQPNQANDEYPKNDTLSIPFEQAPVTYNKVLVNVRTDNSPEEVSWQIFDINGTAIASSEPYTEPGHVYKDTIPLPLSGCYTFKITDLGGNGLCCANGGGLYQVLDNYGVIMHTGNTFGAGDIFDFSSDYPASVEKHEKNALTVSPNPFHESTVVGFSLDVPGQVVFNIYDLCGKLVKTVEAGFRNSGSHEYALKAQDLVPGVYVLQIISGSDSRSRKIAVK